MKYGIEYKKIRIAPLKVAHIRLQHLLRLVASFRSARCSLAVAELHNDLIVCFSHKETVKIRIGLLGFAQQIAGEMFRKKDLVKAVKYYEKALIIGEKLPNPEHPQIVSILSNLATTYKITGVYDKALNCSE